MSQGAQSQEASLSLLDKESASARYAWKRRNRAFQRIMSGFHRGGRFRLLTLTSSPDAGCFQKDFRKLYMRLKRKGIRFEYIRVLELTRSGLEHAHVLYRGDYLDQRWISHIWGQVHKSPVVDIRSVRIGKRMASYLAAYLRKEVAGRLAWSWTWVWRGFAGDWKFLCRVWRACGGSSTSSFQALLDLWKYCVFWRVRPMTIDILRPYVLEWGLERR